MAHALKIVPALVIALSLSPSLVSQSTPDAATRALIEKAIALRKSDKTLPRYTYFMLTRYQIRDKVKVGIGFATLYEYTWIGDLPYARIVELQGKPLQGKALAREQARYDQAVTGHGGLDLDTRSLLNNSLPFMSPLELDPFLTSAYTLSELRQEALADNLTHVIDCTPSRSTDSAHQTATRHATLWITDSGAILRDTYEVVADEPRSLHGSYGQDDFQLIDGNQLPQRNSFHLKGPKGTTGDFEQTFTRFRHFNVSSRVVPATESPSDSPRSASSQH